MRLKRETVLDTDMHIEIIKNIENIKDICKYKEVSLSTCNAVNLFFSRIGDNDKWLLSKMVHTVFWNSGDIEVKKNQFINALVNFWDLKNPPYPGSVPQNYFLKAPLLELVLLKFACDFEKDMNGNNLLCMDVIRPQTECGILPERKMFWELQKFSKSGTCMPLKEMAYYFAVNFDLWQYERCTGEHTYISKLYNENIIKNSAFSHINSNQKTNVKIYFQPDLLCKFILLNIKSIEHMHLIEKCDEIIEGSLEKKTSGFHL